MPPIGRLIGILAGLAVSWGAQHNLTLNESEVIALFMAAYAGAHTLYRKWRAGNDADSRISHDDLPKGTL